MTVLLVILYVLVCLFLVMVVLLVVGVHVLLCLQPRVQGERFKLRVLQFKHLQLLALWLLQLNRSRRDVKQYEVYVKYCRPVFYSIRFH